MVPGTFCHLPEWSRSCGLQSGSSAHSTFKFVLQMGLISTEFLTESGPPCDKIPGPKRSGTRPRPELLILSLYTAHFKSSRSHSLDSRRRRKLTRLKSFLRGLSSLDKQFAIWEKLDLMLCLFPALLSMDLLAF